ncbi:myeloid leukemia factor 1-like [Babylonia areolata]|uniref:myeloid leukemia factor 1-like n=1 Tax=Babylonia areolata TaxID=304850 RepID=UPI003FCFB502
MLSRKFGGNFDDDPFFEGHQKHMREMDKFFHDPFQGFREQLSIEEPSRGRRKNQSEHRGGGQELAPRSLFDFGGFDNMFRSMHDMMENMQRNVERTASDPNCHMLSHSSFASYSNMGGGAEPKVFQASTSTRQAPGGVRETRKTLRDSTTGKEKMAIGRYIGDKGHVIQRQRSRQSGKEKEDQEYVNIGEDDVSEFDREWKERTHQYGERRINRGRHGSDRDQKRPRALRF